MDVIDTMRADLLNVGDTIQWMEIAYVITSIDDSTERITFSVNPLDDDESDEITVDWDDLINVLGYFYEED